MDTRLANDRRREQLQTRNRWLRVTAAVVVLGYFTMDATFPGVAAGLANWFTWWGLLRAVMIAYFTFVAVSCWGEDSAPNRDWPRFQVVLPNAFVGAVMLAAFAWAFLGLSSAGEYEETVFTIDFVPSFQQRSENALAMFLPCLVLIVPTVVVQPKLSRYLQERKWRRIRERMDRRLGR